MIGILLALQVNDWNEERKDQQELRNILQSIVEDMKEDAKEVNGASESYKEENERIKSFLNHDDYSGFTRDSLEQSLDIFYVVPNYRMNSFHRLMDSGISEYGKYEEVVAYIKDHYEYAIPFFMPFEEDLKQSVQRSLHFWRFEQDTYEFNYESELHSEQSDEAAVTALNRLLKSPIPRNILKISYRKNKYIISQYEGFLEFMDEEIKAIEDALLETDS
jgi:hypothetical protein